jgi:hypothetical protein
MVSYHVDGRANEVLRSGAGQVQCGLQVREGRGHLGCVITRCDEVPCRIKRAGTCGENDRVLSSDGSVSVGNTADQWVIRRTALSFTGPDCLICVVPATSKATFRTARITDAARSWLNLQQNRTRV